MTPFTQLHLRCPRPRSCRPSPRAIDNAELHRFSEDQWRGAFRQLEIQHAQPPFTMPAAWNGLWLPRSEQLLLIADDLSRSTLRTADRLDVEVGRHMRHAHVDDLAEDVRVILGLPGYRFFGFRGGSFGVHATLSLYQCRVCRHWWFLLESGSWACRCCGGYDGNAGVAETFTDVIKLNGVRGRSHGRRAG